MTEFVCGRSPTRKAIAPASKHVTSHRETRGRWGVIGVLALMSAAFGGCPADRKSDSGGLPVFNNTGDPSNAGASYVGSSACAACHVEIAARARRHAHSFALARLAGAGPSFPAEATRAGVPEPPDGINWTDISYVIGGYTHSALFIDERGYVLTDGVASTNTQWALEFPATANAADFIPFRPEGTTPLPYEYACFRCHTTGGTASMPGRPPFQDGRPGIVGTWAEAGVGCEACHGPGTRHVSRPAARDLFVDATPATCAGCHTAGADPTVIRAADGYVDPYAQYNELRASGGHANFNCTVCHDPHASATYDRAAGIRNACTACHRDANMAGHGGVVFVRGNYRETMTCESCHMPYTGLKVLAAGPAVVGATGRMGDVRSHIFRIAAWETDFRDMFAADGSSVRKDERRRAAVTVDFVCLRCHTDDTAAPNSAFFLSLDSAWQIATGLHHLPQ